MTRRTSSIFVSIVGSLAICAFVVAQQQQQQPGNRPMSGGQAENDQMQQQFKQLSQDPKTAPDKLFVLCAGMENQCEVEFARHAQQKASNQQVKQVAQQIVQDHQRAQQQLEQVARQLGVQLPQDAPWEAQQAIQILSTLPVDQFEKHFIAGMQADHARAVILYRATAQLAQNDQVKRYAQQQLPVLSQHADQIQRTAIALGLPGTPEAMPASGRIEANSPAPTERPSGGSRNP